MLKVAHLILVVSIFMNSIREQFIYAHQQQNTSVICRMGPCHCFRDSVICSCTKKNKGSLTVLHLNSTVFGGAKKFQSLFFQNCDSLVVASKVFAGLSILDQIKMLGIPRIHIHSNAFRGIHRSPKQIVIQNSNFDTVPSFAFSGLSRIQHFWWRNVSIGRIEKLAFAKSSNIEYFYFRDVRIQWIEEEAFAKMSHISHFYIRGSTMIGSAENNLFLGSKLKELFFEDVKVYNGTLDFVGLNVKIVRIVNSIWKSVGLPNLGQYPKLVLRRKVHEINIRNSTIQKLYMVAFFNASVVVIEKSHIKNLLGARSIAVTGNWPEKIKIINTKIGKIHSSTIFAFKKTRFIEFLNCVVDVICSGAIHASNVDRLSFVGGKIGRIHPGAFSANHFESVVFEETKIYRFERQVFTNSEISLLFSMKHNFLSWIEEFAFAGLNVYKMTIIECIVDRMDPLTFANFTAYTIEIFGTTFNSPLDPTVLQSIDIGYQISFTKCQFACIPSECEVNALLLHPSVHSNLMWEFVENKCFFAKEFDKPNEPNSTSILSYVKRSANKICAQERITKWYNERIHCRRRALIEECVCTPTTAETSSIVDAAAEDVELQVPKSSALIFLVGDCQHRLILDMRQQSFDAETVDAPTTQSIYFYRLDELRVRSVLANVLGIHVLHSKIIIDGTEAFYETHIRKFFLYDSVLELDALEGFSGGLVESLILNNTRFYSPDDGVYALARGKHPNIKKVDIYPKERGFFFDKNDIYAVVSDDSGDAEAQATNLNCTNVNQCKRHTSNCCAVATDSQIFSTRSNTGSLSKATTQFYAHIFSFSLFVSSLSFVPSFSYYHKKKLAIKIR